MTQPDDEAAYARLLANKQTTIRDYDLDAFADGIIAHRNGVKFHENPHGAVALTVQRLSWHLGWNQRALSRRD